VPAEAIDRMQQDPSPAGLARLKAGYLKMLSDLSDQAKRELEAATTYEHVQDAFSSITAQGRRARFRVRTIFHEAKDGDEGNDKDDDKPMADLELAVWTGVDDCGIGFQVGETYVVYAGEDEQTGELQTSKCSRTKRLSDAGADVAYLHIFSTGGKMASRVEGFVTAAANQYPTNSSKGSSLPVEGMWVCLTWSGGARYARSEADGRFAFDGLAAGRYELSVYDESFPDKVTKLAGPQKVDVAQRGCAAPSLLVEQKQ
jgi:hypothetical protein